MTDIADALDHAFLPYIADPRKRALLVELAAGIAHTHTANVMTGQNTGIPSPETTTEPQT